MFYLLAIWILLKFKRKNLILYCFCGIAVVLYWSLQRKKSQHYEQTKQAFQEYQKYQLKCDAYTLKPAYMMIGSMQHEAYVYKKKVEGTVPTFTM